MATKWLDSNGVKHLWDIIRARYDKKLDKVEAQDSSVDVVSDNKIKVAISDEESNAIKLKPGKGLYVSSIPSLHKLTFGSDKNYVYDGSEDVTVPVYDGKIK